MENKINIKSDEITEILGTPPRWVIRWGITVLFLVIATVFVGSIFFRYPDTVMAPVVITAENPPSIVIARSTGKPIALFATDGAWVKRGDTLSVIESSASFNDVFLLSKMLKAFNPDSAFNQSLSENYNEKNWLLGELQSGFNSLSRAYSELTLFSKQKYHQQKIDALESEHNHYLNYYDRLWSQRNLTLKDLNITQKQFLRDSTLFASKVIAAAEFEKSQAVVLVKRQQLESARINLSNAAITIERLKQSIADTRLEYESQHKKLKEELANAYRQLTSSLSAWEKSYLLIAPTTGKLSYMSIWSNVQEVKTGDALFAITPESIGAVQARLVIPFEGAGKVKEGQRVNIKLDGYSYMEFGMVEAKITSISSGYTDKGYPAVASLPYGPVTSYGVNLPLDRELLGVAEITTEDLPLLHRLFSPLKHIYKSKVERQ